MIPSGIAKELTSMMQTWLMNEAACPPAVRQDPDNTLNLLDVDFWLWYRKVMPKGMAHAFRIRFWEMFNAPGTYDILTDNQYKCNIFTLLSKFSLITIELEPDVLINGVLYDSCDGL